MQQQQKIKPKISKCDVVVQWNVLMFPFLHPADLHPLTCDAKVDVNSVCVVGYKSVPTVSVSPPVEIS